MLVARRLCPFVNSNTLGIVSIVTNNYNNSTLQFRSKEWSIKNCFVKWLATSYIDGERPKNKKRNGFVFQTTDIITIASEIVALYQNYTKHIQIWNLSNHRMNRYFLDGIIGSRRFPKTRNKMFSNHSI